MSSMFGNVLDDALIPVRGVVQLSTDLGVFLDLRGRRVFVPGGQTLSAVRRLEPGQVVTLQVNRDYAIREGLVA
jgi:hypothetical protein